MQYLQQIGAIFIPNFHMRVPRLRQSKEHGKSHPVGSWIWNGSVNLQKYHKKQSICCSIRGADSRECLSENKVKLN